MTELLPLLPILDGLSAFARDDRGPGDGPAEENTYGLPQGNRIWRELMRWFRMQRRIVLDWVPPAEDPLPTAPPDLTRFDGVMGEAFTPVLTPYWDEAGQKTMAHLGLDPDAWKVESPHLRAKIREAAYAFCHATNTTTTRQLDAALRQLHREFVEGQASRGETLDQLAARVNGVFDLAEQWRARRIAATEASRAVHAAQEEADIQSGVVAGLELLLSSDACDLCRKVATECKAVRLGQPFAVIGHNPTYSSIRHPPIHPHCQCAVTEILLPQYGGPEHVEWGETLQQPQRGLQDGYTPPAGKKTPEPDPERGRRDTLKPPGALGLTFTPRGGTKTVVVDVARLDAELAKEPDYYVPPGGGADPQNKYKHAVAFVEKARAEGKTVEVPRAEVGPDGSVGLGDGRHRWAALRDLGATALPVAVAPGSAKALRARFGSQP